MNKARGFTLIELMIIVAIIAIIVAVSIPNMLRTKMTANEIAAVACCKTYAEAQSIYRRTDFDGDGILEYAQNMGGNNSLLETSAGAADLAFITKDLATAEGEPATTVPKTGYVFKILTSQGASAEGGTRSYLTANASGGNSMTGGFGISAIPSSYDGTGRNSFILSQSGTIFQKDRGSSIATHETTFNPDSSWTVCE